MRIKVITTIHVPLAKIGTSLPLASLLDGTGGDEDDGPQRKVLPRPTRPPPPLAD
jgi:hypothetical protein